MAKNYPGKEHNSFEIKFCHNIYKKGSTLIPWKNFKNKFIHFICILLNINDKIEILSDPIKTEYGWTYKARYLYTFIRLFGKDIILTRKRYKKYHG